MGKTDSADKFMVFLVVEYFTYRFLIGTMREYELQIGQPQVIIKRNWW
jgi:predicted membrane GTPase involved in stress response